MGIDEYKNHYEYVQWFGGFSPENLIVYLSKCHMEFHIWKDREPWHFFMRGKNQNWSFLACSRWKIRKIDDFRWFLVFWSKSNILYIFPSLSPLKRPKWGPGKKVRLFSETEFHGDSEKKLRLCTRQPLFLTKYGS